MNVKAKGVLTDQEVSDEDVADAMHEAIAEALLAHKGAGNSVAVWDWESDQVVIVPPEEIIVDDGSPSSGSSCTPDSETRRHEPSRPRTTRS